jgi:ppGpp synthetase/RelA/SpoT-type nucleotidyltranferase
MTDRIRDASVRWRAEQHLYAAFGELLEGRMRQALARAGIWSDVTSRPKGRDSLVKKLMRKPDYAYESIGDKAGVRVIVRHRDALSEVLKMLPSLLDCQDLEDVSHRLGTSGVGYRGWHVAVSLQEADPGWLDYRGIQAELQVRTQAQHLWAEMAHDAIYKNESDLPGGLVRRMHLLAGLIEVADDEFLRIEREIADTPGMEAFLVLAELEKHFIRLVGMEWDRELSLEVVRHLLPLYAPANSRDVVRMLDDIGSADVSVLHTVLDREQKSDLDRSVFLLQPEMLMIYERLQKDRHALQGRWATLFPEEELERFALAFGIVL